MCLNTNARQIIHLKRDESLLRFSQVVVVLRVLVSNVNATTAITFVRLGVDAVPTGVETYRTSTPVKEKQLNPLRGDRPVRLFCEVYLEEGYHVAALGAEATNAKSSGDSTSEPEDEEEQLPGANLELELFTIDGDEEKIPEIEEEVEVVDEDDIKDQSTILSLKEDEMVELAAILRALQQQQTDQQQLQQAQQAEHQWLAVEHAQAMAQIAAPLQWVGAV